MSPGMDNQSYQYQYFSYFVGLIKRRWLMIFSIFLITMVPSVLLSISKPVRYMARAQLMLEQDQRANIELSGSLSERVSRNIIPQEKLNSLAEVLTSNLIIHRMIDKLGPSDYAEKQEVVHHFQKEITAKVIPASTIIEINYAHTDAARADKVVNALVEVFQDYYRHSVEGEGAIKFYQYHYNLTSTRLEENLSKLNVLRRHEGILDDLKRVQENTNRRMEALKAEKVELVRKISESHTKIARQEKELNTQPEYLKGTIELIANPRVVEMEQKLVTLGLERSSLATKYTDESPEMRGITAEIESIEREIARLEPMVEGKSMMVHNQLRENIHKDLIETRTELAGLENTFSKLDEQIQKNEAEIHRLDDLDHKFTSLEHAVAADKKMHSFYLGKLEDARFVNSMNQNEITSLRVIERAEGALPNRMSLISTGLASMILSLLMSFGTVFLLEMLRPRLTTSEQANSLLKLPVLATISKKAA